MYKIFLSLLLLVNISFAIDGKVIFQGKCKTCHGIDGHTEALKRANPLPGHSALEIETILLEYKDGKRSKFGAGEVMKSNLKFLSKEDIKAVATYVSTLQ